MVELKDKYKDLENWQEKNGFTKPQKKIKIYYTPLAFAKTIQLVKAHPVEVGWNMRVEPYQDGYKVFDIYVYPQSTSAAHVSVEVDRGTWGYWKATLPDEVERNLNGNGHSHVNMSTFASIIDEMQQHNEILLKRKGFYLFQIWNKRNEITSFFYDVDNHLYATDMDIEMIVEDVDDFVDQTAKTVLSFSKVLYDTYEVGEDFEPEQIL